MTGRWKGRGNQYIQFVALKTISSIKAVKSTRFETIFPIALLFLLISGFVMGYPYFKVTQDVLTLALLFFCFSAAALARSVGSIFGSTLLPMGEGRVASTAIFLNVFLPFEDLAGTLTLAVSSILSCSSTLCKHLKQMFTVYEQTIFMFKRSWKTNITDKSNFNVLGEELVGIYI